MRFGMLEPGEEPVLPLCSYPVKVLGGHGPDLYIETRNAVTFYPPSPTLNQKSPLSQIIGNAIQ